jgi:hypothetical protein
MPVAAYVQSSGLIILKIWTKLAAYYGDEVVPAVAVQIFAIRPDH